MTQPTPTPYTTPEKEISAQALGGSIAGLFVLGLEWAGVPKAPPGFEAAAAVVGGAIVGWVRARIRERRRKNEKLDT